MAKVTKAISPHRRLGLSSTPSLQIAQVAGLVAKKGAPVYIDGNGFIASSLATGTEVMAVATGGLVLGFLQEDGASDSSNTSKVGVTPALPGMSFKGQLIEVTTGSLHVIEQTDLGASGGLAKLSGDTHFGVNVVPGTSRDVVVINELIDPVGTIGGLVGFYVRAEFRQMDL
jgi:hypothetical protein